MNFLALYKHSYTPRDTKTPLQTSKRYEEHLYHFYKGIPPSPPTEDFSFLLRHTILIRKVQGSRAEHSS